ncbi:MAG: flagellar motor switch protein FliN [Gammaproteobacteria bacterium]|nr:flagellar motor switch protein FliN [Gammaproteobacteria bacterium]
MSEQDKKTDDEDLAAEWESALDEQGTNGAGKSKSEDLDRAAHAGFSDLQEPAKPGQAASEINLESVLDIPVTLSMEIGRTRLSIRNLLQLNQGSVVELDRLAGEPMDVMVNGTLIAHGEVVVVNDKFGVRLTDVMSAQERIKKLR